MIAIDQSPIGRTPRSNPATYIKVFDEIRKLYAQLPEAKRRGYKPGRFSFNVAGGRCEACSGNGSNKAGNGFSGRRLDHLQRLPRPSLQPRNAADRVQGQVDRRCPRNGRPAGAWSISKISPRSDTSCETLHAVGLDYVKLGQPSPTLSGGEAQRIKLARELVKKVDRQDALHARRTDHRPALRRHRIAAEGAARFRRRRQHRAGRRTQSRRDQNGRLGDRPRPRGAASMVGSW